MNSGNKRSANVANIGACICEAKTSNCDTVCPKDQELKNIGGESAVLARRQPHFQGAMFSLQDIEKGESLVKVSSY